MTVLLCSGGCWEKRVYFSNKMEMARLTQMSIYITIYSHSRVTEISFFLAINKYIDMEKPGTLAY